MPNFNHQLLPRLELERKDTKKGRFYIVPEIGPVPSVTTVIDNLKDKTFLKLWRERIGDEKADKIVTAARRNGNALHSLCENYLLNEKEWKKGIPATNIEVFNETIRPLLDRHIQTVYGTELKVWSKALKTAGTTDAVVKWQTENTILDFKTSLKPVDLKSEKIRLYKLQAVVYSILVEERYALHCPWSCIIVSVKNDPFATVIRFKNEPYLELAKDIFLKP